MSRSDCRQYLRHRTAWPFARRSLHSLAAFVPKYRVRDTAVSQHTIRRQPCCIAAFLAAVLPLFRDTLTRIVGGEYHSIAASAPGQESRRGHGHIGLNCAFLFCPQGHFIKLFICPAHRDYMQIKLPPPLLPKRDTATADAAASQRSCCRSSA